ncbi:MAG: hypothetical protein WC068_01980 [Caulobacter sp.]
MTILTMIAIALLATETPREAAVVSDPGRHPPPRVAVEGDALVLGGSITKEMLRETRVQLEAHGEVRKVRISSGGGDAEAAMDMALLFREARYEVIVEGLCASSCALYIAPAATSLTIAPSGRVAFHAMPSPLFRYIVTEQLKRDSSLDEVERAKRLEALDVTLDRIMTKQEAFYRSINIDPRNVFRTTQIQVDLVTALKSRGIAVNNATLSFVPDRDFVNRCLGYSGTAWKQYTVQDSINFAALPGTQIAFIIDGKIYYEGKVISTKSYGC